MADLLTRVTVVALLFTGTVGSITIAGEEKQYVTRGKSVNIVWKLENMKSKAFSIFIDTYDDENEILYGRVKNIKLFSKDFIKVNFQDINKRSSAVYNYLGNVQGKETGQIVLRISNLTLDDDGRSFLLISSFDKLINTTISVNFPTEKCGDVLSQEYIVENTVEQLQLISGFCGKPEPTVTCTLNGVEYGNQTITEVSKHNYNYKIALLGNLKPCEKKEIVCTVNGFANSSFKETVIIQRKFTSNIKSSNFLKNIDFTRECTDNCLTIRWEKNIDIGECDVQYQVNFMNGTNATSTAVVLTENSYRKCSIDAQSITVATYIYGNISGVYKLLHNGTSDTTELVTAPCPTKITATTTAMLQPTETEYVLATNTGDNESRRELSEKEQQIQGKTIIIVVITISVVIIITFVILTLTFLVYVKTGRITFEMSGKKKRKNEEKYAEHNETRRKEISAVKKHCDYMELQAARKDMIYQELQPRETVTKKQQSHYMELQAARKDMIYQELQPRETVTKKQQSHYMELQAARKDMMYQTLTTVRNNSTYEVYL